MFHKTRRLNHQPVKFKIKSTLLNIDAKVIYIYIYIYIYVRKLLKTLTKIMKLQ